MKTLIAFYSRTGHTEQLAQEIAAACAGELDPIRDDGVDRSGLRGYLCSGWQAFRGATSAIRRAGRNPADYDLVVIGTPVWNWSLSPPVRTYARRHAGQFGKVAFFCTEGGSGDRRAFDELERICGQAPLATLAVTERELEPARHAKALKRFLGQLGA